MKTNAEVEQDILNITLKIHLDFPELSKYLNEMPLKYLEGKKTGIDIRSSLAYYNSLVDMLSDYSKTHIVGGGIKETGNITFPGNPYYPVSEDIYSQGKEEQDLDPENVSKKKARNEEDGTTNELDFSDDMTGEDLDIPGSELDDQQESVGSEDEENNYYSLGGDGHNNLEEDNG